MSHISVLPNGWKPDSQSIENCTKSEKKAFDDKYKIMEEGGNRIFIGAGAFGTVYLAKSKESENQDRFAIKFPTGIADEETAILALENAQLEIRLWKNFAGFPYILRLLDKYILRNNEEQKLPVLVTVTPYIKGGTLRRYIEDLCGGDLTQQGVPNHEAWLVSKQLLLTSKFVLLWCRFRHASLTFLLFSFPNFIHQSSLCIAIISSIAI